MFTRDFTSTLECVLSYKFSNQFWINILVRKKLSNNIFWTQPPVSKSFNFLSIGVHLSVSKNLICILITNFSLTCNQTTNQRNSSDLLFNPISKLTKLFSYPTKCFT